MSKKILWTLALIAGSSLALGSVAFAQMSTPMYQSGAMLKTDAAILSEIESRMSQDPALNNSRIQVFSDAGNVTLNGFVPSTQAENEAVYISNQVAGVKSVRDNLMVSPELMSQAQYPATVQPQYAVPMTVPNTEYQTRPYSQKEPYMPSEALAGSGPDAPAIGANPWGANLVGSRVVSTHGEDLGRVAAVTSGPGTWGANSQESRINFIIVDPNVAGMRDRLVAIPFRSNYSYMPPDGTITLDITRDQLANAPTIDKYAWPSGVPGRWATDSYRYFGETPQFK